MNNEGCPMCQAFDEGYDKGFIEGYKEALKGQIEMNISIVENLEKEDEDCYCDCDDCC